MDTNTPVASGAANQASTSASRTAEATTRRYEIPASYRRFVEAQLALALAEAKRDADRRADDHPGIRRLATVPDQLVDPAKDGVVTIIVFDDKPAAA